jgi:hypothetical protein
MKVLFAVNNDNVSEAIAKKYEREYKDILSYKNVYYFNAIIRELQKDKTYNRIVISEDLEPFANNNYDMIDKFLLEKYSNISKEAKTINEERIEVIVLCADRRRKAEDMFIKMYNLEIYNAIIGQDRSIEEVCKLIYSPRDKNIAKQYYEIPISDLSGQDDNENNVSEAEVENILAHYKRLGKNEDKYVDSFNNIISQYTDTQLKIIIRYLPIHVKAVLEERSSKYQQLVTSGLPGQNANFEEKTNKYKQKAQKKGGFWRSKNDIDDDDDDEDETIIDKEFTTPKMTKPIVIPSDMNTNNVQRINSQESKVFNDNANNQVNSEQKIPGPEFLREENSPSIPTVEPIQTEQHTLVEETQDNINKPNINNLNQGQQIQERPIPQEIVKPEVQIKDIQVPTPEQIAKQNVKLEENSISQINAKTDSLDLFEASEEQNEATKQKPVQESGDDLFSELLDIETSEIKNEEVNENESSDSNKTEQPTEPVKRGRGRPRTRPIVEVDPNKPKRGRGRPRKVPIEQIQGEQLKVKTEEEIKTSEPINEELNPIEKENDLFSISEEIQTQSSNNVQNEATTDNTEQNVDVDLFNMVDSIENQTNQKTENELLDLFDMNMDEPKTKADTQLDNNLEQNTNIIETNVTELQQTQTITQTVPEETGNKVQQYNDISDSTQQQEKELINNYDRTEPDSDLFNNKDSNTVNLFEDNKDITTTNRTTTYSSLNTLLTADKKIVAFVGTTKNGTSFVVNNTAEMLSSMGISTAILDMTKSKNAYYIYTNNEEELRNISTKCMKNLENGIAEGLKITKTLTVYTEMPGEEEKYNIDSVLSTLVQNYSAVLIDTDFDTPVEIFDRVQEIYLVQSMDVLTIQPLTAFLRNLKSKNILRQEKLRIVINKSQRIRSLNVKTLIGGMSCYNAPNMSYMTELFDKDSIRYCEIPFETQNYIKYLESLVVCSITLNGYTKALLASLKELSNIVYPLVGKQTYSPMNGNNKKDPFSKQMSNTLNKMRNKGY